jgi:hypothetical protein
MAFTNSQFGRPLWDMRKIEKPEPPAEAAS